MSAMRIVEYPDGRAAAVCDEELTAGIDLGRADRVMHRPLESRIRQMVSSSLGLVGSRDRIGSVPGPLVVGNWQPKPAAGYLCVLLVATTPAHLAELIVSAMQKRSRPILLFTLTRAMWSVRSETIADPRRVAMIPLDDVLECKDGEWIPTAMWDEYLGAFVQNSGIKLPAGFSTLEKKVRVAKASGTAGKIKDQLRQWYRDARKHLLESGELLPRPTLAMLGRPCGISDATVSRWLRGDVTSPDQVLVLLWSKVGDEEYVRKPLRI